jgi:ABC-type bacteriocin/lantibiotic exporter with double-glycine peptidase domain
MKRRFWFYTKEILGLLIGIPSIIILMAILLVISPVLLLVYIFHKLFGE